jgi:site-specific DNA-methyltransferase (adenine-specific)
MASLAEASVDACVTDPPYGLKFMGKGWDHGVPGVEFWQAVYRVLKPGAHLLAFGGTRTYHRLVCAIEDAGFEIRDQIGWAYGSGFPKSLDVSKAIDKQAGAEREVVGERKLTGKARVLAGGNYDGGYEGKTLRTTVDITAPATPEAAAWQGWGTALKPAWEPICVARKPLVGTVAANVLAHGTGALNIDGCRVGFSSVADEAESKNKNRHADFGSGARDNKVFGADTRARGEGGNYDPPGRWPANLVHDGSDEVLACFPETKSGTLSPDMNVKASSGWSGGSQADRVKQTFTKNSGSAARFFYAAKASKAERGEGNNHPTVKPLALMCWLVRLVCPPGGTVLDPFAGSGTTGLAARAEGFEAILMEQDPAHVQTIVARYRNA